jgi:hypothetical protein
MDLELGKPIHNKTVAQCCAIGRNWRPARRPFPPPAPTGPTARLDREQPGAGTRNGAPSIPALGFKFPWPKGGWIRSARRTRVRFGPRRATGRARSALDRAAGNQCQRCPTCDTVARNRPFVRPPKPKNPMWNSGGSPRLTPSVGRSGGCWRNDRLQRSLGTSAVDVTYW